MEKEITFVNLCKGQKDGKPWFRVDYIIMSTYKLKSDFINALEYDTISKKVKDNHLIKCQAILGVNDYDRVYLSDIKI